MPPQTPEPSLSHESLAQYLTDSHGLDGSRQSLMLVRILLQQKERTQHPVQSHAMAIESILSIDHRMTFQDVYRWHRVLLGANDDMGGIFRVECPPRWAWPLRSVYGLPEALQGLLAAYRQETAQLYHESPDPRARVAWALHHAFFTLWPFTKANGLLARLLMNASRRELGLPWITIPSTQQEDYERSVYAYARRTQHHPIPFDPSVIDLAHLSSSKTLEIVKTTPDISAH